MSILIRKCSTAAASAPTATRHSHLATQKRVYTRAYCKPGDRCAPVASFDAYAERPNVLHRTYVRTYTGSHSAKAVHLITLTHPPLSRQHPQRRCGAATLRANTKHTSACHPYAILASNAHIVCCALVTSRRSWHQKHPRETLLFQHDAQTHSRTAAPVSTAVAR